jgi:DNA repair protein RadC
MFDSATESRLLEALIGRSDSRSPTTRLIDLLEADDNGLVRLGFTQAERRRLLCCAEVARRYQPRSVIPSAITKPRDALPHLESIRTSERETLLVLLLDSRLALLDKEVVAIGSLAQVVVTPREVFAPAFRATAAALLIAHNHPTGATTPSPEDFEFTKAMATAGRVLQIDVVDHMIVARRGYFSFRESGHL